MFEHHIYYDRQGNPISRDEGAWLMEASDRKVAYDTLVAGEFITEVSTVYLVINHQWRSGAPPLIFETMIFSNDPDIDNYQWRYSTEEQAAAGHRRVVAWLKGECPHPDEEEHPAEHPGE